MAVAITRFSDGLKVRAARLEAGWTQKSLAERAGVSRTRVAHIEAGLEPAVVGLLNESLESDFAEKDAEAAR